MRKFILSTNFIRSLATEAVYKAYQGHFSRLGLRERGRESCSSGKLPGKVRVLSRCLGRETCNRHQLTAILAFVAAEEGLLTRIFQANYKIFMREHTFL